MMVVDIEDAYGRETVREADARPRGAGNTAGIQGTVTGTLAGFADDGRVPLVVFPGQIGTAAVRAQAVIDLQGADVGRDLVLVFDRGDLRRPIVLGCLRQHDTPLPARPESVEVDVDGERLLVTAREQIVLRCGDASITLTRSGKVLIEGTYVSSRSSGVVRIKGGSVQIN